MTSYKNPNLGTKTMKCKLRAVTHSSIFWPCKDGYLWMVDCCHMAGTLCSIFSQTVQDCFCSLAPGAKLTLLGYREMPNIVVEFKTCSLRTRRQLQCLMRKIHHLQQRTQGVMSVLSLVLGGCCFARYMDLMLMPRLMPKGESLSQQLNSINTDHAQLCDVY